MGLTTTWLFSYDGDGTLVGQLVTDGVTATHTAFYMGGGTEVISDGVNETVRKYYALAAPLAALGGAPLRYASSTFGMSDNGGMKYLISDHLGSTVAITDSTGALLAESRYMPFGEPRADTGSLEGTDRTYTGQRDVPDTGLMDYRARNYSPGLGRFIQPDTIVPGAGNSQAWNRYSYVLGNPISYVDPSGNMPTNGCNYEGCGRFEGEEYYDYVYNELHNNNERKENSEKVENTVKVLDTVATVFIEPYDWYVTASECIGGYCSPWIALGLLPFIPSSIGTKVDGVIDISKSITKVDKVKPLFSARNFRKNVLARNNISNSEAFFLDAHHVFSQKFEDEFLNKFGIDINDPKFGILVDSSKHRKFSYAYNAEWKRFLSRSDLTTEKILDFGRSLGGEYGYTVGY